MQTLKEYQMLDMQKRKIEQEILDCEDRKKAKEMQNMLKDFQSKIFALEDKATLIVKKYDEQVALLDKISKDIANETKQVSKVADEDINSQSAVLIKIKDNLSKLEKELIDIQKTQEQIVKDNSVIMKNAVVANKNMGVYKERYAQIKSKREPEIEAINKKMESLVSKIDKNALAKYKAISAVKPLPVFVPFVNGKCNGCRMEVSIIATNNLKQKGYIECENCGRIIYFDEK